MAHHPIGVDNSDPATVDDTARTLGVSKKRTDELIRAVRRTLHRDLKTGNFVVRSPRAGKTTVRSRNGNQKVEKASSATRRRVSR